MFRKILIANRGEIAVRIIRACREMGIRTVAVYSEADEDAMHVRLADEAVCIGPAAPSASYLDMDRLISTALATKAEAIHPGFGFLSENADFAEKCAKFGITFIGPSGELIDKMGNKSEAKHTMKEAGIPVVPGTDSPVYEAEEALEAAEVIGFPVMIKASAGGGGKGMRLAWNSQEFPGLFHAAKQEAVNAFGDGSMYLERYVQSPRHIEVQILADKFGTVFHLGERDCSVQRRHQKMIEESPCAFISPETREKICDTAVQAAKAVGEKSVEMIHVKDITKVTGYVRGGCSPLCMKKPFKTTFHITAKDIPTIIVSAGKIGYQIELEPSKLIELTNGQCADIVKS